MFHVKHITNNLPKHKGHHWRTIDWCSWLLNEQLIANEWDRYDCVKDRIKDEISFYPKKIKLHKGGKALPNHRPV